MILPPDEACPFFVTANRYWANHGARLSSTTLAHEGRDFASDQSRKRKTGLTLVLLHSTSFHKETWEPCLSTLFDRAEASQLCIREAWAIEAPNHGRSATLNARVFSAPPFSEQFGCEGYSQAVHRFLTMGPVDFRERRLVGIGHSLGANTILMAQTYRPRLPFLSLVMVEPMVSPGGNQPLEALRARLVLSAKNRRDSWPSRDAARLSLPGKEGIGRKKSWRRVWDDRVVDVFIEHGIVAVTEASSLSSSSFNKPSNDDRNDDVTCYKLACTKKQEMIMYQDAEGSIRPVQVLDKLSATIPVHLILGEVKDFIPAPVQMALRSAPQRTFASIATLPGVGHLIPQESPDQLALALLKVLLQTSPSSKL